MIMAGRTYPARSRPVHQMPRVIGNRHDPRRKLVNPISQRKFAERRAARRQGPSMPCPPLTTLPLKKS